MRRGPVSLAALLVALATATVLARLAPTDPSAHPSALLQRFLANPDPAPTEFRALRHLEARNDHFHSGAWMDVWTEGNRSGFDYDIVAEGGSQYIRQHVFRETLETERRMWATGAPERAAVTPANYVFEEHPTEADGLASLTLRPRRKDVLLVDGTIFVRPDDGELVRIEGALSKSPSFWTRSVHITRWYQRFAGVRMPVALETSAAVRVAGQSTFKMLYEYETVNGTRVGTPEARSDR